MALVIALAACSQPSEEEWLDAISQAEEARDQIEFLEIRLDSSVSTLTMKATYGYCFNEYVEAVQLQEKVGLAELNNQTHYEGGVQWAVQRETRKRRDLLEHFLEKVNQNMADVKTLERDYDDFTKRAGYDFRRCLQGCRSVLDAPRC